MSTSMGNSVLLKKILTTLALLAVYRIGVHIPTPGVDSAAVESFFGDKSGGIFSLFNTFTGGALSQFSIFALGIMPYISASIIFQLLSSSLPYFEVLKKEGESGRKKINQYTRYATILLAIIQGWGISTWLLNSSAPTGAPIVNSTYLSAAGFKFLTVTTLTAGTAFIMWLGEQITERGIGNGSSLIIFTGIAASIPHGAVSLWRLIENNEMSVFKCLLIIGFMVAIIFAVIYLEVSHRKLTIQHSQRVDNRISNTASSHLPIKLNMAGVIPPIFASSLLMLPATLAQVSTNPFLKSIQDMLNPGGMIYNVLLVVFIVFFTFFYTEITFNPEEVSENLKKSGAFIPGVRAGKATSEFLLGIVSKLNVVGATYLCLICVMPGFLISSFNIPFYFGGTSLLILVGVALDTSQQIQSHMISQKYQGFGTGTKIKSRRVQF